MKSSEKHKQYAPKPECRCKTYETPTYTIEPLYREAKLAGQIRTCVVCQYVWLEHFVTPGAPLDLWVRGLMAQKGARFNQIVPLVKKTDDRKPKKKATPTSGD